MSQFAIGLIGGIATGKSLASQYFKALGIEVIDADQIARDLVKPHSSMLQEIVTHFGAEFLTAIGELDRLKLRTLIFANPAERLWLEERMHPLIRQRIDTAIDAADSPYCVIAIPLLKRREDYPRLRQIIMIDAPLELEIERLMKRDHLSAEEARRIISSQPSRRERLAMADVVIVNEGSPADLFEKLKACKLIKS